MKYFLISLLILILPFSFISGQEIYSSTLLDQEILTHIEKEVKGRICFEHIRKLGTFNRVWGSDDYHDAANYIAGKTKEYGLQNVVIEKFPIKTGKELFWMHNALGIIPWNGKKGELRLVQPYPGLISSTEIAPAMIANQSRSAHLTAEVVFVGTGLSDEDYKDKDVKGKIVLGEDTYSVMFHEKAVHEYGAAGTMNFFGKSGGGVFYGDYRQDEAIYNVWINAYNIAGTKQSTFSMNLSTSQGEFFKGLIEKGEEVVVSVDIDAELREDGDYELITAVIPGYQFPDEEYIFYAHFDHTKPGSHDNASGDAVLLEIARTLSSLIKRNIIPQPKRSIRFMWIPHMSGLNMYFHRYPEKIGKVKAGTNVDCVGLDFREYSSSFWVALPPHSLYTPLGAVTCNLVESLNNKMHRAVQFNRRDDYMFSPEGSRNVFSATVVPYEGRSDEYTANTRTLNIPSIYFHDDPIPPRHSQVNFLKYIDSSNLKRICYLGSIISYAFCSMGIQDVPAVLNEIQFRGESLLLKELWKAKKIITGGAVEEAAQRFRISKNIIASGIERQTGMLESVRLYASSDENGNKLINKTLAIFKSKAEAFQNELDTYYIDLCKKNGVEPVMEPELSDTEKRLGKIIPAHNPEIKGSPGFAARFLENKLGPEKFQSFNISPRYSYGHIGYYEILNFIDGRKSILDIYNFVLSETISGNYDKVYQLSLTDIENYIGCLEAAGVINFK